VYLGLLASYHLDLAAGASITLVATLIFFVALAAKRLTMRSLARSEAAGSAA